MTIYIHHISNAAVEAGLNGYPLCVHSSFRSFGGVEGGPQAVIDGLINQGCTVMAPTFSEGYMIDPPADDHIPRNGLNYDSFPAWPKSTEKTYSSDTDEVDADMGAIPATLVNMDGRLRSGHPLSSFSAVGPKASELITGDEIRDVYAPIKALARLSGFIVLMGVDLTKMTAIHLAEQMAGRRLLIRWVNGPDGKPARVENGSCSKGFYKLDAALEPIERRIMVGNSLWRIFPAKSTLELASEAIQDNPSITHCEDTACDRCNDMVAGGPIL